MAEIKYSKAMTWLEEIIEKIQGEEIDVDELSEKVKEAATLIKTCKERIEKAELEVKQVVEGFEDDKVAWIYLNTSEPFLNQRSHKKPFYKKICFFVICFS